MRVYTNFRLTSANVDKFCYIETIYFTIYNMFKLTAAAAAAVFQFSFFCSGYERNVNFQHSLESL